MQKMRMKDLTEKIHFIQINGTYYRDSNNIRTKLVEFNKKYGPYINITQLDCLTSKRKEEFVSYLLIFTQNQTQKDKMKNDGLGEFELEK